MAEEQTAALYGGDGYGVPEFVPRRELLALMAEHPWLRRRLLKRVGAMRILAKMAPSGTARWVDETFWAQECKPLLHYINEWAAGTPERYAGASQAHAALVNVHRNTRAAIGAKVQESDWHRQDVRRP